MMKEFWFLIFFIFLGGIVSAHNPNEAYFIITKKENTIEIEAELPWTMRDALIQYNPELNNATTREEFERTFVRYIRKNLILENAKGEQLDFVKFQESTNHGHSHQSNYKLIFRGYDVQHVTNSFMFNLYDNQKNYHRIFLNSKEYEYTTTPNSPSFYIAEQNLKNHSPFNIMWIGGILFGLLVVFGITKKTCF